MFGPNHYVPILKTKPAELKALSNLSLSSKQNTTPLFEFILNSTEEEKIIKNVNNFASKVLEALGQEHVFFVDFKWVPADTMVNGKELITYVFEVLRSNGLKGIPVTGLSRNYIYQNAIAKIIKIDQRGCCVRVETDDFASINNLLSLVGLMQCNIDEIDLLIDFGPVQDNMLAIIGISLNNLLPLIPNIMDWRTFTLSASSFPSSMGQIKSNAISSIPRTEWKLWTSMYNQRTSLPRMMSFSDYGIDNPNLAVGFDPLRMQSSANIRYTHQSDWIIFKGRGLRTGKKNDQFFDLALAITQSTYYCGTTFSWGDLQIDSYAKHFPATGGTLGTWRAIGYNHHIEYVTSMISNLSWP